MRLQFREARIGLICAVVVALAFIVSGAYVATHGNPWPGAALGGGGVGLQALVATFVRGRNEKRENSETQESTSKGATPPRPQQKQQRQVIKKGKNR